MALTAGTSSTGTRHIHGATETAQACGSQHLTSTSTQEIHQEIRTEAALPLSRIPLNVNHRRGQTSRADPRRQSPTSRRMRALVTSPGCRGLTWAVTVSLFFLLAVSSWEPAASSDVSAAYSSSYLTSLEKRTSQA